MASSAHGPMEQFEIKPLIDLNLAGYDISFTNSSLFMTLSVLIAFTFYWFATRKSALVPGRLQLIGELIFDFTLSMIKENVGKEGIKYFG